MKELELAIKELQENEEAIRFEYNRLVKEKSYRHIYMNELVHMLSKTIIKKEKLIEAMNILKELNK